MPQMIAVAGLHFGDEGKGTVVDYLSRKLNPCVNVLYCGGPQSAHNVVDDTGKHHTFAQFGSGTFAGSETIIYKNKLVKPETFLTELNILNKKIMVARPYIDFDCKVVTPYHELLGRLFALRFNLSTCGLGVGQAINGKINIYVKDLLVKKTIIEKLEEIRLETIENAKRLILNDISKYMYDKYMKIKIIDIVNIFNEFTKECNIVNTQDRIMSMFSSGKNVIFEGSQGALLDKAIGFSPHITQANVLINQVDDIVDCNIKKIGILRPYSHRHGRGPLVTYGYPQITEDHNEYNLWQGKFRTGCFDMILTKYAIGNRYLDYLALTNIDKIEKYVYVCTSYECDYDVFDKYKNGVKFYRVGDKIIITSILKNYTKLLESCKPHRIKRIHKHKFIKYLEKELGVQVSLVSKGPTHIDKEFIT